MSQLTNYNVRCISGGFIYNISVFSAASQQFVLLTHSFCTSTYVAMH